MSGASGAHGVQIQRELERIMKRYAPEKLANVDKLMATHHNREEELLRKVGDCRVAEFRGTALGWCLRGWARLGAAVLPSVLRSHLCSILYYRMWSGVPVASKNPSFPPSHPPAAPPTLSLPLLTVSRALDPFSLTSCSPPHATPPFAPPHLSPSPPSRFAASTVSPTSH